MNSSFRGMLDLIPKLTIAYSRSGRSASSRRLSVLIVDDAPENLFLLSRILSTRGVEVELAVDGAEAIQKALAGNHDFILMDMEMPVIDGYDSTKILREKGYDRPIIALTAHCAASDHVRILDSGCDAHLTKPIDFALLFRTISKWTKVKIDDRSDVG
jgi:CheY-like chemotaxis protein